MLSMATSLPQILKDFSVFKALKCASYVSSKHIIFKLFQFCQNLHSMITFALFL